MPTSFGLHKLVAVSAFASAALSGCTGNSGDAARSHEGMLGVDAGSLPDSATMPPPAGNPDAGQGGGSGGGGISFDAGTGVGTTAGHVPQTCTEASSARSYIGCEYWPTVTLNTELFASFPFAIAAGNPTSADAHVIVDRGAASVADAVIKPGEIKVMQLPWVTELKQEFGADGSGVSSALVPGGAYHVTSSVPITLYQFNPLEFELTPPPTNCPGVADTGHCYSYTNDASILLPTSALRGEYYVISYPTHHYSVRSQTMFPPSPPAGYANLAGFVTVTATEDNTTVTVDSTAHVRAGAGVTALAAGGQGQYVLNQGDVLELASAPLPDGEDAVGSKQCKPVVNGANTITLCPSPPEYDLTGSHITADKAVSVIGGHDCTMNPYDTFACDHMEESLFPVDTLGRDLVVTAPITAAGDHADKMFVRVLSAFDGNHVTFDPPSVNDPVTLDAGKWIEIGPVSTDFRVQGDNKLMVAEFMVGGNAENPPASAGDPSESIAIPTEQYRLAYTFFAPSSYTSNYVNIVARTGSMVKIDGTAVDASEFQAIGGTGLGVARHKVPGGAHSMTGNQNFGIVVYGYGRYTSYMYPGGLNLETIKINPK